MRGWRRAHLLLQGRQASGHACLLSRGSAPIHLRRWWPTPPQGWPSRAGATARWGRRRGGMGQPGRRSLGVTMSPQARRGRQPCACAHPARMPPACAPLQIIVVDPAAPSPGDYTTRTGAVRCGALWCGRWGPGGRAGLPGEPALHPWCCCGRAVPSRAVHPPHPIPSTRSPAHPPAYPSRGADGRV